jgi:lipopolysaccharide/colanic/teichoic acid biosynthesis glycosyltransferase
MLKRLFDVAFATFGLIAAAPILLPVMLLIWRHDGHSPFYVAPRVGCNGRSFRMVKLRSMVVNADWNGVDSTSATDGRITSVGRIIRRYKLDELTQLWNVIRGDMSLVGPRPNVQRETDLYTDVEKKLLTVRPGITDFASVVFSDEGEILARHQDADLAYNQLIRPWKSRLGLLYVENRTLWLDLQLIAYTGVALLSKPVALRWVEAKTKALGADEQIAQIAGRRVELVPFPPPGGDKIVTARV